MKSDGLRLAYLFPGQGAQYSGMGKDLWEKDASVRELFDTATVSAGIDVPALLFEADEEVLRETENTQVAITAVNLAVFRLLRAKGLAPHAVAGFSLGEFSALVAAGVLSIEQVFPMVRERGAIMARASQALSASGEGPGMAAVLGLPGDQVESIARESGLELFAANFNSSDQTVLAGTHKALSQGKELFTARGAKRWIPLKVSGPFHSPLLKEAQTAFAEYLSGIEFADPAIVLLSNVTGGAVTSGAEAKNLAIEQVTSPVRWTAEEAALSALGVTHCLETGPGKVLGGLWKKTGSDAPCLPAGTDGEIEAAMSQIAGESKE